jgi:hypothetical protein
MKGKRQFKNEEVIKKELGWFLEAANALDTTEIEDLLKKELEYKLRTKEILDMKLFRIRSLKYESAQCYWILKNHVFHVTPDRKDYS